MLVTPLLHASPFEGGAQYRPAKDADAFNALLPPAIEFVEGSSTGAFAVPDAKYTPINGTPQKRSRSRSPPPVGTPASKISASAAAAGTPAAGRQLYTGPIDTTWPARMTVGAGLHNTGNTCFLNSALQCLLHTPPLLRLLAQHGDKADPCRSKAGACVACALKQVAEQAHSRSQAFTPTPILSKLTQIAKHLRRGRQEDSHEFLRYLIEGLQKSCLAGHPPKLDPKIAETTWVHKLFGGRLRSRVHCRSCGHDSDTFDSILDLSVDVTDIDALPAALKRFTSTDVLKGTNKYKCEKCKTLVVADKQFTIHDAPAVLTVHLKRFSPLGRKLGHLVRYPDALPLAPYMSAGQFGPRYALFGVISHAGGGPHSGHYYAHVRGADGRWREANDDSVAPARDGPTGLRSAYILFYIREKGQALEAALAAPTGTPSKALAQAPATPAKAPLVPRSVGRPSIVGAMKRKPDDDGDAPAKKRQIGPRMPDGGFDADPQARALGAKIASAGTGAKKLVDYEDAQSSDTGEAVADADDAPEEESAKVPAPSAPATPAPAPLPLTMPAASFYGSGKKKAVAAEEEDEIEDADGGDAPALRNQLPMQFGGGRHQHQRRGAASPFNRVKGSNNLHAERQKNNPHRYGKTPRRRL